MAACFRLNQREREFCEDAVLREIKEETNLNAKIIDGGKPVETTDKYGRWINMVYLCEADNASLLKISEEHTDFIWIKPEEWKKYDCVAGIEEDFKAVRLI